MTSQMTLMLYRYSKCFTEDCEITDGVFNARVVSNHIIVSRGHGSTLMMLDGNAINELLMARLLDTLFDSIGISESTIQHL